MNQRIAVRAIVRDGDKVLLIRIANSRQNTHGKYELPGGRVEHDEQPEEALARLIRSQTGLILKSSQLAGALTYVDDINHDVQYAEIYFVVHTVSASDIHLSESHDHFIWRKKSAVRQEEVSDLTSVLLNKYYQRSGDEQELLSNTVDNKSTSDKPIIYTDGGSRGNPGPSAAAFVVTDASGGLLAEGGAYLGITTNNQAEYHGVHLGLEKAKELGAKAVEFRLDSLLVVNQLNGTYVIRNRELWPIHERINGLINQFEKVTFRHVKREFNQRADSLVNKILDDQASKKV